MRIKFSILGLLWWRPHDNRWQVHEVYLNYCRVWYFPVFPELFVAFLWGCSYSKSDYLFFFCQRTEEVKVEFFAVCMLLESDHRPNNRLVLIIEEERLTFIANCDVADFSLFVVAVQIRKVARLLELKVLYWTHARFLQSTLEASVLDGHSSGWFW